MAAAQEQDYYTVPEAARELAVSPATVWRWIKAGRLAAYRVGPRNIRIKRADLAGVVQPARSGEVSSTMERERAAVLRPPSDDTLVRRQALVREILAKRQQRVIAPVTSAELVQRAREEESWYGPDR